MSAKNLIVIAGPTASGKTALAVQMGKRYKAPVLSADSRQFYREMKIGTAKPDAREMEGVEHFFIDSKNIDELYGAGHFERDALTVLAEVFRKGDVAILVGGSGLYIDALLRGVDEFEEVPGAVREQLNSELEIHGLEPLREELRKADPDYFEKMDSSNPQRVVRALEVIRHTGKKFSSFREGKEKKRPFHAIKILLNPPREILYENINRRVEKMMNEGLLDEVRTLWEMKSFNALKTVGYRELYDYLEGKTDLGTAIDKIKQHTRNYAKRQVTWFRKHKDYREMDPADRESIFRYVDAQLLTR